MKIKDKFAALLRRWANKVSPETNPLNHSSGLCLPSPSGLKFYNIRRVCTAYRISKSEEADAQMAEKHGFIPKAADFMREDYKKRVVHAIIAALWERGVIEYTEEREPDSGELRISGSLYVGIPENNDNANTNPFNQ